MLEQPAIDKAYLKLCSDARVNVWHMSLYIALLYLWKANGCRNPVSITRKGLMTLAHINSIVTYHKCVKQLQQLGYIDYTPSYNAYLRSRIRILTF